VFTNCREFDPLDEYARLPGLPPSHSIEKGLKFGYPAGEGFIFLKIDI
jgi:hypothetical protein